MFAIDRKQENDFDIIVLLDTLTGASVEILPACGAILYAFKVQHGGQILNVVDSYATRKEFEESVEAKGFKGCKLSPFVCRMKEGKYQFGGTDYTIEKFFLGKHALHGLIYDAAFEVVKLEANAERASVELVFSYTGTDAGFPFAYDCRIVYELTSNATLSVSTILKNQADTAIPLADGWHPYFSFGKPVDQLLFQFPSAEMMEFDAELIPTGKNLPFSTFTELKPIGDIELDNSFLLDFNDNSAPVILQDPEKKIQLEIHPDRSYPILQIYIPPHRNSIALENISAAPDAFNNQIHLTLLQAGAEAVFRTSYRLREVA